MTTVWAKEKLVTVAVEVTVTMKLMARLANGGSMDDSKSGRLSLMRISLQSGM
jgi:hypothetical protein